MNPTVPSRNVFGRSDFALMQITTHPSGDRVHHFTLPQASHGSDFDTSCHPSSDSRIGSIPSKTIRAHTFPKNNCHTVSLACGYRTCGPILGNPSLPTNCFRPLRAARPAVLWLFRWRRLHPGPLGHGDTQASRELRSKLGCYVTGSRRAGFDFNKPETLFLPRLPRPALPRPA